MTAVSTDRTRSDRLPYLDGYRGLAALGVVVFHVASHSRWVAHVDGIVPNGGAWVARLGNFSVCVFFLLSGLVVYRPFLRAHLDGEPAPSWRGFVWRRALRIYPAYWVVLSTVYLLGLESEQATQWYDYVAQYLLLQNYVDRGLFHGLFVAWTLCVEFGFYLTVPLIAAFARRLPGGSSRLMGDRCAAELGAIALLFTTGWAFRLFLLYADPNLPGSRHSWLPNYFDWFALGMTLGVAHAWRERGGRVPRPLRWLAAHPFASLLFAVQLYWIGVLLRISGALNVATSPGATMTRFAVNGAAAFLVLVPAVLGRHRALAVFDHRLLLRLGAVSYGVYLWHTVVLLVAADVELDVPFLALLLGTVAASVVIAHVSYGAIELPFMSVRERRPKEPAAHVAAR